MRILLDTHIVVFAANDTLASGRKKLLLDTSTERFVSAVSLWELAKLTELGYLDLPDGFEKFIRVLCGHPHYAIAPYDAEIMIELVKIAPQMHKDPADQIIVATARKLGASLMTDDRNIRRSGLVDCL